MAEASEQGDNAGGQTIRISLQRLRQRCDLISIPWPGWKRNSNGLNLRCLFIL